MKTMNKIMVLVAMVMVSLSVFCIPVQAETVDETSTAAVERESSDTGDKAMAAGLAIGLAAGAGAIAMGLAIAKGAEGISRQPEAEGKIRTQLMLGLVFIETAIIYALIVAILIIFVL